MPKITFEKETKLDQNTAFDKLRTFLSNDTDLKKLDSNYKCQFDETKHSGTAKGSKFEADLKVEASGAGSKVRITVNLPLLLSPFKGMVEKTLEGKLGKLLG